MPCPSRPARGRAAALTASLVLLAAAAQAQLTPAQRSQALQSGRVGAGVAHALASQERVRVMVAFALPAGAPAVASAFGSARRQAIRDAREQLLGRLQPGDLEVRHRYGAVNAVAGSLSGAGLMRLLEDPRVLRVDRDEGGSGSLAQAVPLAELDGLPALGLGGLGVQVAVLDTGVDLAHPDLGDAVIAEKCFCSGGGGCCPEGSSDEDDAQDDHGHGSNVTGIVTSDGDVAPVGGAPQAEIVAIKVMDKNNSFCCSSDVVAGLDWIIQNRPDVDLVNMSLGTAALFSGDCDTATSFTIAFATAIDTLRASGVLTTVSSGNQGSGTQMPAPACVANAIAVGAVWDGNVGAQSVLGCSDPTTQADQVTCFSNSNASTDLFAPGAPTTSARLGGGSSTFFGTSQAAPLVAACAALALEANPALTPDQLEAVLEDSTVMVTDATNGLSFPRLDCSRLVACSPPGPGMPPCCDSGVCQLGEACGPVCFTTGVCRLGGVTGNECRCGLP